MEIFNKYYRIARSAYKNELNIDQYKEAVKTVEAAEEEIKTFLKTKTVNVLRSVCNQLGSWHDSRDKKQDLINKAFDSLTDYFLIGRNIKYFMGEKTHTEAKAELINGTTAETLETFYTNRREQKEKQIKSCENPQSLAEFSEFCRIRGEKELSHEQLETYERLKADVVLKRQQREEEQKQQERKTVTKIEIENVEFAIHETKHSKTRADIYTVLMLQRVDKKSFLILNSKAKDLNGYYSKYSDRNANPPIKAGFNFKTLEDAKTFMGLKEENQTKPEPTAEAKPEEVKNNTSIKMRERAEAMIEKAEASLNQERTTNTHRQAAQAASSEAKAQNEIIFGKKLLLIAEGLESGTIKYLHKLKNGKQLEQLESILSRGFQVRTKDLSYTEKQKEDKNPTLDVNFIEFPYPIYGANVIHDIFIKYDDTSGMKRDVKEILKYTKRNKNKSGYLILEGEYIIKLFKTTASKIPNYSFSDTWAKDRILDNIKNYERIIKLGLTDLSILKTALRELTSLTEGTGPTEEEKQAKELKELERSFISKKIAGFFPTPKPLIEKMFEMCKVYEGETILEPSAGLGHIAQEIKEKYPKNDLSVIEFNYSLWEVLEKKGFNAEHMNFISSSHKYDVIFMNPPFEKNQDIEHVKHAFSLLNNGGRLVAIMAGNKGNLNKITQEFNEFVNYHGYMDDNEEGSFKSAFNSTGVSTITVYLEKS